MRNVPLALVEARSHFSASARVMSPKNHLRRGRERKRRRKEGRGGEGREGEGRFYCMINFNVYPGKQNGGARGSRSHFPHTFFTLNNKWYIFALSMFGTPALRQTQQEKASRSFIHLQFHTYISACLDLQEF